MGTYIFEVRVVTGTHVLRNRCVEEVQLMLVLYGCEIDTGSSGTKRTDNSRGGQSSDTRSAALHRHECAVCVDHEVVILQFMGVLLWQIGSCFFNLVVLHFIQKCIRIASQSELGSNSLLRKLFDINAASMVLNLVP